SPGHLGVKPRTNRDKRSYSASGGYSSDRRRVDAVNEAQQRRFPAPILAHDPETFPLLELETNVLESPEFTSAKLRGRRRQTNKAPEDIRHAVVEASLERTAELLANRFEGYDCFAIHGVLQIIFSMMIS